MSAPMNWINFFQYGLHMHGTECIIPSEHLGEYLELSSGEEAFHSAFDMVREKLKLENEVPTVANYDGPTRPAFGYVWFDFDSKDGGETARVQAKECLEWLNDGSVLIYFSGNKGFHLAIPFTLFGISINSETPKKLKSVAAHLKKSKWDTLDTTVFNPQRKFRALSSRHPKSGLYKTQLRGLDFTMEEIRTYSRIRQVYPKIPPPPERAPLPELVALLTPQATPHGERLGAKKEKEARQVLPGTKARGVRAFNECAFLKRAKETPATLSEPEWYAAASIVGTFQDGAAQFHDMSKGHPGYSAAETDAKLTKALGSSGPRTCSGINELWGKCNTCIHFQRITTPAVLIEEDIIPSEVNGFYIVETAANGTQKRIPQYEDLLKAFSRDFKFFRDAALEKTYVWTGTHYRIFAEAEILAWCEAAMFPAPKSNVRQEFLAKVEANHCKPSEEIERFFYESVKGKLNLRNGVLHIESGVLSPHDAATGFRYALPYDFDPNAECPKFARYLEQVTLGRGNLKATLLEFMGYCLWPAIDDHCFLWLSGTGRNGKSTFLNVLMDLVGRGNYSSISLDKFSNPFYVAGMDHKLVNIAEENDLKRVPSEILGTLKGLSAGSSVEVSRKFEHAYSMLPTAKLVFAANNPPTFAGTEDALKSRMIIVPFDMKLEEHGETETTSTTDWQMNAKLREELSGILNLALEHLRNFVTRTPRKIHRNAEGREMVMELMRDSDPVERWIYERVKFLPHHDGNPPIGVGQLYLDFKQFCGDVSHPIELNGFAKRFKAKVPPQSRQRRGPIPATDTSPSKKGRVYCNIALCDKAEF